MAESILWVEAEGGGAVAMTTHGSFDLGMTLAEVEGRLDSREFLRVHRAYLVNLRHVEEIRPYDKRRLTLRLKGGNRILASRRGSQALRDAMG
jgi:DNA-binding LytR/AlgR family response regulator